MGKIIISLVTAIILSLAGLIPINAADEIVSELNAAVVGLAEYSPGDDGVAQISIQNNNKLGEINYSAVQAGLSSYFGSAVSLTATLSKEFAPVEIKTGQVLLGTLNSGATTPPIPFNIKISDNASAGDYYLTLTMTYRTLKTTSSDDDSKKFKTEWAERTDVKKVKINIKSKKEEAMDQQLDFKIARVDAEKFAPGDTGAIQLRVQNNKTIEKIDSSAMQSNLSQDYGAASGLMAHLDQGNAPFSIKTKDVLLGTLPAGQATPALPIMVEVEDNAPAGTYPVHVSINYRTLKSTSIEDGDPQLKWSSGSASQDISIEIKEKLLEFEVVNVTSDLTPGTKNEIQVTFRNKGNKKAQDASVKLSAASPLSMTDNTAYLGTLQGGESASGTFGLKVMGDSILKEYSLDASVQYVDSKGDKVSSDVIKVPVTVNKPKASATFLNQLKDQWLVFGSGAGIIVVIWLAVGVIRVYRRKNAN
jgi:hypothetical protein